MLIITELLKNSMMKKTENQSEGLNFILHVSRIFQRGLKNVIFRKSGDQHLFEIKPIDFIQQ